MQNLKEKKKLHISSILVTVLFKRLESFFINNCFYYFNNQKRQCSLRHVTTILQNVNEVKLEQYGIVVVNYHLQSTSVIYFIIINIQMIISPLKFYVLEVNRHKFALKTNGKCGMH